MKMIENIIIILLVGFSLIFVLRKFYRSYKKIAGGRVCGCEDCKDKNSGCPQNPADCTGKCPGSDDFFKN